MEPIIKIKQLSSEFKTIITELLHNKINNITPIKKHVYEVLDNDNGIKTITLEDLSVEDLMHLLEDYYEHDNVIMVNNALLTSIISLHLFETDINKY